jgi:starch synthase
MPKREVPDTASSPQQKPSHKPISVVMIGSECAPAAKVGGLADVVHGLSRELQAQGNPVEIILPKYDCMRYDRISGLTKSLSGLMVPFYKQRIECDVYSGRMDGLDCFFIDPHSQHNFFNRNVVYGHKDDNDRFAFFSRAALEFMHKAGKSPDIIHCHDWQTGLVPVLLFELYQSSGLAHSRVCYTLHNVGHQGLTNANILRQVGLDPGSLIRPDRLEDNRHKGSVNVMKGGIVYSNFVTTVSPHYAHEIKTSNLGMGLQQTLAAHHNKFGGVLNGIDYGAWNPEVDKHIACNYSVHTLNDKYKNKKALRERLLLREDFKPLVAVVSRLDQQKGVDLIAHAMSYSLGRGSQFVLLGSSPNPQIDSRFRHLKRLVNDNPDCHLEIGYDEDLSHLIYAGADMIVIPSAYEPCGLTQLISMKYGTVPIVRSTGGLADTVFDVNYSDKSEHARNGYVFNDYNPQGLESALGRAIEAWYAQPDLFRSLITNGMNCDYSWKESVNHYLNIYKFIKAP